MTTIEKNIIISTGFSHLIVHAMLLTFPSLYPSIKTLFNIGYDSYGSFVFFSSFLFGLGAIPAGYYENKNFSVGSNKRFLAPAAVISVFRSPNFDVVKSVVFSSKNAFFSVVSVTNSEN